MRPISLGNVSSIYSHVIYNALPLKNRFRSNQRSTLFIPTASSAHSKTLTNIHGRNQWLQNWMSHYPWELANILKKAYIKRTSLSDKGMQVKNLTWTPMCSVTLSFSVSFLQSFLGGGWVGSWSSTPSLQESHTKHTPVHKERHWLKFINRFQPFSMATSTFISLIYTKMVW